MPDEHTESGRPCTRCGIWKPLTDYSPNWRYRDGYMRRCKACMNELGRQHYAKKKLDPKWYAERRAKARRWLRDNPEKFEVQKRRAFLRQAHGLTFEAYAAMMTAQNNRCGICGTKRKPGDRYLHVDHDHQTGALRGLLCDKCNSGLGHLGDNIAGIRRALAYLEDPPAAGVERTYAPNDKRMNGSTAGHHRDRVRVRTRR